MNKEINEFKDILKSQFNKRDLIVEHLYLNIFLYDEDWYVRYKVAKQDYGHNILMYNKECNVRNYVVNYTKDKCVLEHLSNDEDDAINNRAKNKLKLLYNE